MRTLNAIVLLCPAWFLVHYVPLDRWRKSLGFAGTSSSEQAIEARRLAAHVERAGSLLPFPTKCLPRAIAFSWMLRRRRIGHAIVVAVRPAPLRDAPDGLHAWVDVGGEKILGELPGPWVETLRLEG
jgi:hypothetical protein